MNTAHLAARRRALLALALPPVLAACTALQPEHQGRQQDGWTSRDAMLVDLARRRGVCSVSFVVLHAGQAGQTNFISGCGLAAPPQPVIYQAASLSAKSAKGSTLDLLVANGSRLDLLLAGIVRQAPDAIFRIICVASCSSLPKPRQRAVMDVNEALLAQQDR